MHDLSLAAWFGGALAGAVAVNGPADVPNWTERLKVANAGWARWPPSTPSIVTRSVDNGPIRRRNPPMTSATPSTNSTPARG